MGKPEGVRLHRADGTVLNVELFHEGLDEEGIDCWAIANAEYRPGDNVSMDVLPARTSVGFMARVPPGTRPEDIRPYFKGKRISKKNKERTRRMTSTLHVLDHTGDTRIEWDPANRDEVEMARKAFKTAKDKKMLIYKTRRDGSRGELLREFDPNAERIIATRQTVGG